MDYPGGKKFAFSIFDDTDVATLEYIRPVYDFLAGAAILTTKSVWALGYHGKSDYAGSHTLENPDYAEYISSLRSKGFEIGFHGPTMVSSERQNTERALELFYETLGCYPRVYAAHSRNLENLYWGVERITSPVVRKVYAVLSGEREGYYQGHVEGSPYFWGDLAREHLDYVRSFTYRSVNLLDVTKDIVYKDRSKQWINNLFLSCDAEHVEEFNRLLRTENQERLERQGGVCIVSTHFGKGFTKAGELTAESRKVLEELSSRDGWFAPVSELLDHLTKVRPPRIMENSALRHLEYRWLLDLIVRRMRRRDYEKTEVEYLESMHS